MNERINELVSTARQQATSDTKDGKCFDLDLFHKKFAELIVEECRNVVTELYRNTPLELCGPLITADEKIAEHFYGVEE